MHKSNVAQEEEEVRLPILANGKLSYDYYYYKSTTIYNSSCTCTIVYVKVKE